MLDLDAVPLRERRHGAVRDPHQRVPGTDARDRAPVQARGGRGGLRAVGTADGGDRDARRGRRAHDPAPRRGGRARCRPASLADEGPEYDRPRAEPRPRRRADPTFAPFDGDPRDGAPARCWPRRTSPASDGCGEQYDSGGAGQTGRGPGLRRRGRADPGHPEGRWRSSTRREGPVRPARPVPGRGARGGRGGAQRRGHGRAPARRHELPELRQPRAARGDVAVRRVDPRDARRLPRARHARDRRQRELLQRVRRLGDLARRP